MLHDFTNNDWAHHIRRKTRRVAYRVSYKIPGLTCNRSILGYYATEGEALRASAALAAYGRAENIKIDQRILKA